MPVFKLMRSGLCVLLVCRARYVESWFLRGKVRARQEFQIYFGTLTSEAAKEFKKKPGARQDCVLAVGVCVC